MAQRTNPTRRVPGNPLLGILRTLNQQGRYSDRRRSPVTPTVISGESAAFGAGVAGTATDSALLATVAAPDAMAALQPTAEELEASQRVADDAFQQDVAEAEPVAASDVFSVVAATAVTDDYGSATVTYGPFEGVPVVVATAVADFPVTATVQRADGVSATVLALDATGARVAGVALSVAAFTTRWPE